MKPILLTACAAVSAMLVGPLVGEPVIEGVTATASSWWTMPSPTDPYQAPINLVNNAGMSAPYDIAATHESDGDAKYQWHSKAWVDDPNPTLTFDLGGTFDLKGIHIWNGNQVRTSSNDTNRGVKDFTLWVSSDGTNYSQVGGTRTLTKSPDTPSLIFAQTFDLNGQNGVTHVQLRVVSNYGSAYTGLSEVMFTAVGVPETFPLWIEKQGDKVILTFPSTPGQVFDIYRSVDLESGFENPLVVDLPAAASIVEVDSQFNEWPGGFTMGDSTVNFDLELTIGTTYVLVPSGGANGDREIAVVSWSGSSITLAEEIQSDLTWNGFYTVKTPTLSETVWEDTALPAGGKAFYRVGRR